MFFRCWIGKRKGRGKQGKEGKAEVIRKYRRKWLLWKSGGGEKRVGGQGKHQGPLKTVSGRRRKRARKFLWVKKKKILSSSSDRWLRVERSGAYSER